MKNLILSILPGWSEKLYEEKRGRIYKGKYKGIWGFPGGSVVKNPPEMQEAQEPQVHFLGQEDPLKEGMATHSSILVWRIPQTEEPGRLQSTGPQRVGHD